MSRIHITFTPPIELDKLLKSINTFYELEYNKVLILKVLETSEYVCCYNLMPGNFELLPNTLYLHRKKYTNTFYTINALNLIVKKENDGFWKKDFEVNWENYKNKIMLCQDNNLKELNTELVKIHRF
jgi:hypothetical protein